MEPLYTFYQSVQQEALDLQHRGAWMLWLSFVLWILYPKSLMAGLALGCLLGGLLQSMLGVWRCNQVKRDINRTRYYMLFAMSHLHHLEIPYIENRLGDYQYIRWADTLLLGTGILLCLPAAGGSVAQGLGIVITLQAAGMLWADIGADQRGLQYVNYLKNLSLRRFRPDEDPCYANWPNPPA